MVSTRSGPPSARKSARASGSRLPRIASICSRKQPAMGSGSMSIKREREKELPGGRTIAHGLLSLSLAPMFVRSVMGLKGLKNTLNYGADRIRYLAPVPAGSKLRGRLTISETEDVPPNGLRVNYHLVIEIEGGKRPACVAELIALHYR